MYRFKLYESATCYYIIGSDITDTLFRVLRIDRTTQNGDLSIVEDEIGYNQGDVLNFLEKMDEGNKSTGGIKLRCTIWGILGFIKFTGPYYMLVITKKSTVAMIGGHYIYQVDGTELIPLIPARTKSESRTTEDNRFLNILNNVDLTRFFYFSYSYDISRTLQSNLSRARDALSNGNPRVRLSDFNSMFVWNTHLLHPAVATLKCPYDWCRVIIHGYINQAGMYLASL